MKILVDMHCFDYKTTEGINTYLQGIYTELIRMSSEVDFYFVARKVKKIESIFGKHPNVHYIALNSKNKIYRLLFEIPAIIKKYHIDYAHFQYTSPLIKNCKTIVTTHDILFLDFPQYFPFLYKVTKGILFKLSAKRADILFTVSDYSKKKIVEHFHIEESKILVTPNAVGGDFQNIDKENAELFIKTKGIDKYILYVSRMEPRKNHIRVLKSYHQLELWKKGYDLVFIGKQTIAVPEFENYMQALSSDIKKHIHIFNQIPFNELLYWLRAASLFIYPSLAEGFGIPPLEAAMADTPCICSNKTAMNEYKFFNENLIDTDDEVNLNKMIEKNLFNSEYTIDHQYIKKQILERYNWRNSAQIIIEKIKQHYIQDK